MPEPFAPDSPTPPASLPAPGPGPAGATQFLDPIPTPAYGRGEYTVHEGIARAVADYEAKVAALDAAKLSAGLPSLASGDVPLTSTATPTATSAYTQEIAGLSSEIATAKASLGQSSDTARSATTALTAVDTSLRGASAEAGQLPPAVTSSIEAGRAVVADARADHSRANEAVKTHATVIDTLVKGKMDAQTPDERESVSPTKLYREAEAQAGPLHLPLTDGGHTATVPSFVTPSVTTVTSSGSSEPIQRSQVSPPRAATVTSSAPAATSGTSPVFVSGGGGGGGGGASRGGRGGGGPRGSRGSGGGSRPSRRGRGRSSRRSRSERDSERRSRGSSGSVVSPCDGTFSSGFGPRWGTTHKGVDLAAPIGTPIYAVMDGEVISSGPASGFGNWIRVQHENGEVSVYGHMQADMLYVSVGDTVQAGDEIAGVGNEGQSTGPHLHFEIWPDGSTPQDPQAWLESHGVSI